MANPFGKMLGVQGSPEESAAILKNGPGLSGQYARTAELTMEDRDAYGNLDPRNFNQHQFQTAIADNADPWSEHYENVGDIQQEGRAYALPEQVQQRDDAMERLLSPIHARGQYDVAQQRIASQGTMGAAQAAAGGRQATQDASMARNQATAAAGAQRQRNTMLEARAKEAQTSGRSSMNPMSWMFGQPTGEEQAAELRGQQQFGAEQPQQPGGESSEDLAMQLFSEFSQATPEQVAEYAQQELGIADPAEIQALVAQYAAMQGR